MPTFLRFLFDNPILLFVIAAWVAGAIGNAARAAKKARERGADAAPAAPPAARPPEEVAAEMRRILGMDMETRPVAVAPAPRVERPVRREVVAPERPPEPVRPTTQERRLDVRVDPHVGEALQRRPVPHGAASAGRREPSGGLGNLGGRVRGRHRLAGVERRLVDLTDLKRAFVASEILGAPLALRGKNEMRD